MHPTLRLWRFIAVLVLLGLAGIYRLFFDHPAPKTHTAWVKSQWAAGPVDAGTLTVDFDKEGFQFLRAQDAEDPARSFAVIRRKDQHLRLDDVSRFYAVERDDQTLWATFIDEAHEGGKRRGLLGLRLAADGKPELVRVPMPTATATFGHLSAGRGQVSLGLQAVGTTELAPEYVEPGDVAPQIGPGKLTIHSRNGGRSWWLER